MRLVMTSPELKAALRQGFQLGKVWEAWHWDERSPDIMREYIVKLAREKAYASGFPAGVESPEAKEAHCSKVAASLRLPVDPSKFHRNVAYRSYLKLLVNSLW